MPLIQPPSHSEVVVSVFSFQCFKCFGPCLCFSHTSGVGSHITHVSQYFGPPIFLSSVALPCFAFLLLSAGLGSAARLLLLSIREDYLQGLVSQNGYGHLFRGHFPPSEGPRPRPHKFHFPWAQIIGGRNVYCWEKIMNFIILI